MTENLEIQDAPIFSYAIASGDMRYIEIGEREIYLRNDPKVGLIYRGEIAGCGPECHFELNEILLEFAMSCEGCREESFATKEVIQFGEHLGEVLLARTYRGNQRRSTPIFLGLLSAQRVCNEYRSQQKCGYGSFIIRCTLEKPDK
jgi:hypothetical protein